MAIARLHGGPLDGQVIPLDAEDAAELIVPYGEGQVVYRRTGALENTGHDDGPTSAEFSFAGATEDIDPDPDGRNE